MEQLKVYENDFILKKRVNFELAKQKKLIVEKDCKIYSLVETLYLKALEQYILKKVDLKEYDDIINNSELAFGEIEEDTKFAYHIASSMNLKHIFIRNFLYVEKIEDKYIEVFLNRIKEKNYDIDDELLDIVDKTYKDVINDNYVFGEYRNVITVKYDGDVAFNFVNSNVLVLYIQYGRNKIKLDGEDFFSNQRKKEKLLLELAQKLEKDIKDNFDVECKVFVRDSFGS